jgi:NADH-quinone oxidoreductase subunit A
VDSLLPSFWPFALFMVLVFLLIVSMLVLSAILGQRHMEPSTGEPYESGIVSTGSARLRFDAKFYLMAMFFVIFDLEAVFIYAWAVAVPELGWMGYGEILVFITILMVALIYLYRLGALEWGTKKHETHRRRRGAT